MAERLKDTILEEFRRLPDAVAHMEMRELWKKHGLCEDARDIEGILTTLTEDCIYEIVNTPIRWTGKEGAREFYQTLLMAIPDAKFDLQRVTIGPQGVFEEAIITGSHQGSYLTYVSSGKPVRSTVGIFFPYDHQTQLFTGERIYANLDHLFQARG